MKEFNNWHTDMLAEKTVQALIKNNFKASYIKDAGEAVKQILAIIEPGATIGVGGSWTVKELGLSELLEKQGHIVYDHNKPGLAPEESMNLRRKELTCDVFLTGTNAITLDGKLVNVDGAGNRVAAMIFGPKKVIVVAGVNKIVRDVEDAERRIEFTAAPINNKRLNRPNPCVQTGRCMDCQGPTRICNVTTIIRKKPTPADFNIFIIGGHYGF